jgi:hypothetical protein
LSSASSERDRGRRPLRQASTMAVSMVHANAEALPGVLHSLGVEVSERYRAMLMGPTRGTENCTTPSGTCRLPPTDHLACREVSFGCTPTPMPGLNSDENTP